MKEAREAILKKFYTLLNGTVEVDGLVIPYYLDKFGNAEFGIYKETYRGEADDTKHHFAEIAFIELTCFARGKSEDFVAEISRKVRGILKASVSGTIELDNGLQATYTRVNGIDCTTQMDDGATLHRDTIRLELRIDENI